MRRFSSLVAAAVLCGIAFFTASGPANAFGVGDRTARLCEDSAVLAKISEKFRYQVRHVPHLPDVAISEFRRVHQHRYLPYSEEWPIARRYCGATALMSDGRQRTIWYLIEDGMGMIGVGDNVEFCVSGFDRWYVYNGRCRVLW